VYVWASSVGGNEGGEDFGYAVAVDGSGNVVVTGSRNSSVFIGSFNSSGSASWSFVPSPGRGEGMTIDGNGNINVTGQFNGTSTNDFDPGSGTATLTGTGCFVARYTSSGGYVWAIGLNGTSTFPLVIGRGVVVNGNGIYIVGLFKNTADFDPGSGTASLSTTGSADHDIFLARYREAPLPKRTVGHDSRMAMRVVPNPFTGTFALRCDGASKPMRVEVVDMMGQVVESTDEIAPGAEIHLGESLPAGAYLVRVTQGEAIRQMLVRKVR
jgi:hypothetical protein